MAESERFVVHVPFTASDLAAGRQFARMLTRSVSFLPEVNASEATLSEEGDQSVHYRLFCDRLLDGERRCVLRAEHEVPCASQAVNR